MDKLLNSTYSRSAGAAKFANRKLHVCGFGLNLAIKCYKNQYVFHKGTIFTIKSGNLFTFNIIVKKYDRYLNKEHWIHDLFL